MRKTPKVRLRFIDKKGDHGCHRGHKVGDCYDFDTERGNICPMLQHVAFPAIDILRYGGIPPRDRNGQHTLCCPDVDVLMVVRLETDA